MGTGILREPTGIAAEMMRGKTFELDPEPHMALPLSGPAREWCRRCGQHVYALVHTNFKEARREQRRRRALPQGKEE